MKTPLDNFELFIDDTYRETRMGIGEKEITFLYGIKVWLQHKTLPIKILEQHIGKTHVDEIRPVIIQRVYDKLIKMYLYGKAQTFSHEITHGTMMIPNGKLGFMYSPEWDKEKEAWFILDENNNKIYEK
jgi:uncharacterized protein (DUF111 family)